MKILADLKATAGWWELIRKVVSLQLGLKMRCVDWRTSALFVFFGEQENSFSSADLQKILDASLFSRKFPKHHPSAGKYGLKKKLMHM